MYGANLEAFMDFYLEKLCRTRRARELATNAPTNFSHKAHKNRLHGPVVYADFYGNTSCITKAWETHAIRITGYSRKTVIQKKLRTTFCGRIRRKNLRRARHKELVTCFFRSARYRRMRNCARSMR
jgi:hypothetical protein